MILFSKNLFLIIGEFISYEIQQIDAPKLLSKKLLVFSRKFFIFNFRLLCFLQSLNVAQRVGRCIAQLLAPCSLFSQNL